MSIQQINISLVRHDGKRGVDFDSPRTQQFFLNFIRGIADPSTRYFIPVLENNGIIPSVNPDDDDYNVDFNTLLKRIGVVPHDIPNNMRSYFLVAFQGGSNMQLALWKTIPLDRQQDFITYLKKTSNLKNSPPGMLENQRKISELIIPILEEGKGWIPEELTDVERLAQRWSMTNHQLAEMINRLWERMTTQLSAEKAGRIVGRSAGTMRRWVREGKISFNINNKGHLTFTRETLIDHINKPSKGVSMRQYNVICQAWIKITREYLPGSDLSYSDGFSLHESKEDCQVFINSKPHANNSYPQGTPYRIKIDHVQYMAMRNNPHGIRIHGDHPELKKTA